MAEDHFEDVTNAFLAWLTQMDVKMSSKMAIVDFRAEGRGRGVGKHKTFQ
jgi:hypothetical protein